MKVLANVFGEEMSFDSFREQILKDYATVVFSRELSILGRQEVLKGNAGFGIFGDGKELPQVVAAQHFQKGDFLSGYYRDQTFCLAKEIVTAEQLFSQLYADTEKPHDPSSSGRQMNAHFATPFIDVEGNWLDLANRYNISSYISQTAGQMPKSIGLAFASKVFKSIKGLDNKGKLSNKGNEVCFCTIGDASTAEGHFFETVHTSAVLQIPLAVFIWDDGYGISVPSAQQIAKGNISKAIQGMAREGDEKELALDMYTIKGWDYADLHKQIEKGITKVREKQMPAIFHIQELTQPLGHSTSGSHERYKSKKRLKWEKDFDCNKKMREWILANHVVDVATLDEIDKEQKQKVKTAKESAFKRYIKPIVEQSLQVKEAIVKLMENDQPPELKKRIQELSSQYEQEKIIYRNQNQRLVAKVQRAMKQHGVRDSQIFSLYEEITKDNQQRYNSHLYSPVKSAADVSLVKPSYLADTKQISAYGILNQYFDALFVKHDNVVAFGEDVGQIGDVNQGFANLQKKYGENRVFDTGIRELTIVGQAIGMALRGLRPIAEIQYIDYLLYGLQPLSDDVATLSYRTAGTQACPIIIRSRGHRFEGIWHSGSPMALINSSLRGFMIGVPRNMTQAASMYNALIQSNDPGIVIEPLNGYRRKERLPENLSDVCLPFGLCETIREGTDITVVSYGSTLHYVLAATDVLNKERGISSEVIDIQTIQPFDKEDIIVKSLAKTNRILFVDEDIEGGYTSYMMQEVIHRRAGFYHLDATPATHAAKPHRTSYGRDGEYFGKPNLESICDAILAVVEE